MLIHIGSGIFRTAVLPLLGKPSAAVTTQNAMVPEWHSVDDGNETRDDTLDDECFPLANGSAKDLPKETGTTGFSVGK